MIESVFLAQRNSLQLLDLSSDILSDIEIVEEPVSITCMHMSRSLICGTSNGQILSYDLRSNDIASTLKAHMSGVSAIEVRGDQLASFGFNTPFVTYIHMYHVFF